MDDGFYVNVGCGLVAPADWVNLDGSYSALLAKWAPLHWLARGLRGGSEAANPRWPSNIRVHDVRRGMPFRDNTVVAIYASHFLEHLTRWDARTFLRECHRVLALGGRIRLVVPDLLTLALRYVETKSGGGEGEAAEEFLEGLACCPVRDQSLWVLRALRGWKQFNVHKWFYDGDSLAALLAEVGFREPLEAKYLDSGIARIRSVEIEDRLVDSVCIEAVK